MNEPISFRSITDLEEVEALDDGAYIIVIGNGEAVAPAIILYSSTANSSKKFKITVDDTGALKATEVK